MSGSQPPAKPEGDSVWDFSEDARPGLDRDDGAVTPEQISPDVITPDLDRNGQEPGFGPL